MVLVGWDINFGFENIFGVLWLIHLQHLQEFEGVFPKVFVLIDLLQLLLQLNLQLKGLPGHYKAELGEPWLVILNFLINQVNQVGVVQINGAAEGVEVQFVSNGNFKNKRD